MARRARHGALARALEVHIVFVRNLQDIIAFVRLDCLNYVSFRVFKGEFDSVEYVRMRKLVTAGLS